MWPSRTALLLGTILSVILAGVAHHIPTASRRQTGSSQCTNPIIRQEWSVVDYRRVRSLLTLRRRKLSSQERQAYISAVQCLARRPPQTPTSVNPDARSRYDDFVLSHAEETLLGTIHFTVCVFTLEAGNWLSNPRHDSYPTTDGLSPCSRKLFGKSAITPVHIRE